MRTIKLLPGMLGFNVEISFGLTTSGKVDSHVMNIWTMPYSIVVFIWTKVAQVSFRARQRRYLKSLPDYLLKDIGLTREEVCLEYKKPFWR